MKRDSMLYTVLFSFLTCAVFVFLLSLANELTKERVESNRRLAERTAILAALGADISSPGEVDAVYEAQVDRLEAGAPDAGTAPATRLFRLGSGEGARYAMNISGPGLWGGISAVLAVDAAVGRIAGLEIVSQNETPGLGGRIGETWFTAQFRGEAVKGGAIRLRQGSGKGDPDPENGELDAITGATLTSAAVERLVNGGLADLARIRDEGGLE